MCVCVSVCVCVIPSVMRFIQVSWELLKNSVTLSKVKFPIHITCSLTKHILKYMQIITFNDSCPLMESKAPNDDLYQFLYLYHS